MADLRAALAYTQECEVMLDLVHQLKAVLASMPSYKPLEGRILEWLREEVRVVDVDADDLKYLANQDDLAEVLCRTRVINIQLRSYIEAIG